MQRIKFILELHNVKTTCEGKLSGSGTGMHACRVYKEQACVLHPCCKQSMHVMQSIHAGHYAILCNPPQASASLFDKGLLERSLSSIKLLAVGVFLRCLPPLLGKAPVPELVVAASDCLKEAAAAAAAEVA